MTRILNTLELAWTLSVSAALIIPFAWFYSRADKQCSGPMVHCFRPHAIPIGLIAISLIPAAAVVLARGIVAAQFEMRRLLSHLLSR